MAAPLLLDTLGLRQDMHVHSTFSDGTSTIADNLAEAARLGLRRLCCVDHVRQDTPWVPAFVEAVRQAAVGSDLQVYAGIEAKLLDRSGRIDVPANRAGVDFIYIADHQVPLEDGPHSPSSVRKSLAAGHLTAAAVIDALIDATIGALRAHPNSVIAHLFSVLPKIGMSEADVPAGRLAQLAEVARDTHATLEIDERWRCPSLETARVFQAAGVPVVFSTDSHRVTDIGRYTFAAAVYEGLAQS